MIQSISKPERVYIGSSVDINKRHKDHIYKLYNNRHYSTQLQRHINKYGVEDLEFSILEFGDYFNRNHLLAREQGWFIPYSYQNTELPYFNNYKIAGSPLGIIPSEESKRKNREANTGEKNGFFGHHHSEETKAFLKEINKNNRPWWLGKHLSEDHKHNLSVARIGMKASKETCQKISDSHLGENNSFYNKQHTEDAKQKMKDAWVIRRQKQHNAER